jgi:hypothetical protein
MRKDLSCSPLANRRKCVQSRRYLYQKRVQSRRNCTVNFGESEYWFLEKAINEWAFYCLIVHHLRAIYPPTGMDWPMVYADEMKAGAAFLAPRVCFPSVRYSGSRYLSHSVASSNDVRVVVEHRKVFCHHAFPFPLRYLLNQSSV